MGKTRRPEKFGHMRFAALSLAGILLVSGCASSSVSNPPLLNVVSTPVTGARGATLSLPNGDAVAFPANALLGSVKVTLSSDASETPGSPQRGWSPAPGTMTLTFGSAAGTNLGATQNAPKVTLTFTYSAADAAAILAAQAPVLEITTSSGKIERISADARFDAAKGQVTATVLASQLNGAVSAKFYVARDGSGVTSYPLGPKLWNSATGKWQPEPFTVDPTKRTVVMVHGIFSSVESAFPCEQAIINAGGYQQAVGIDYDWTQPPATEAPFVSNFVNSLPLSNVDLEAHSYGTVVTLAALPQVKKTVGHVVLLGGPLPLNGAPQADPGYLRDLLMLGVWIAYPSEVYKAYKSGMINAMASNSPQLKAIDTGLSTLSLPPFVQAAGGSPLPQEKENDAVYLLYLYLYGDGINDGIVEQKSATQAFKTKTNEITFLNDDHIQLECDPQVQNFVGPLVAP
jgi:pimeloyl-ACP methyl ester carboxylesterase